MTEVASEPGRASELRTRAEEIVGAAASGEQAGLLPEDAAAVLHELRVHQVELEMQNEELHRVQEDLMASEARYLDLYEFAPVGYLSMDADGVILEANLTLASLLHRPRGGLVGKQLGRFVVAEDQDVYYELRRQAAVPDSGPQSCEIRFSVDGAAIVWVRLDAVATSSGADGPPMIRATVADVSERKRADEALHAASLHSRSLIEASLDPLVTISPDGKISDVNRATETATGIPRDRLIGTDFADYFTDPRRAQVGYERALREGAVRDYALSLRSVSGSVIDVEYNATVFRDEADEVQGVFAAARDVTERRKAENEVRRSEEKFAAAFRASPDLISITRLSDGMIVEANEGYERLLGYIRDESVGATTAELSIWADPADHARFVAALEEFGEVHDFETTLRRKDGSIVAVLDSARKFDLQGDECMLSVFHDITGRKLAEEEIARRNDRIQSALASVIDIAGNIVEAGDPYTAGHQRRVAELATVVARELGMQDAEIDDIRVAGLLHDVGKVTVPAEILSKPGALSVSEFDVIKDHAEAGHHIITAAHMEGPISELVYQHHERCDGSGYPQGLVGDQILMGARVLAVADTVEAMVSHRPYRPALGIDAALTEIEQGAGRLYDSRVVEACLRLFREKGFAFPEV